MLRSYDTSTSPSARIGIDGTDGLGNVSKTGSDALEIPSNLLHAIETQSAVLFLGAGASFGARHPKGEAIPSGLRLRDMLADKFLGGALKDRSLANVADYSINESSLTAVQTFLRDLFSPFEPAKFHELIPTFGWHGIVGTNYDLIIEKSYQTVGSRSIQTLVPFIKNGQTVEAEMKQHPHGLQYLKLHGCISAYSDREIPFILATEQYAKYSENRTRLFERLRDWGTEFPIIFCGYSINDPNIQTILFDLFDNGRRRPQYYIVTTSISDIEERYWASHRISALKGTFQEFIETLAGKVSTTSRSLSLHGVGGGNSSLRRYYVKANVTETDRLMSFLSDDVDHVCTNMSVHDCDPKQFYKGYDDGWGSIAQNLDIPRKATDTLIIDAVLTEEHGRSNFVDVFVIKGAGGNGKSIILKRSAWTAANDYDKLVLYAKPGGALNPDALEELFSYTNQRIYLFVDKAAYVADELEQLIKRLNIAQVKVTLVLAERDAEWNVRCEAIDPFVTRELPIRYLSEAEVRLLISKLKEHDSLGIIKVMSEDEQIRMFVDGAQRQLLVALHEVTLGKPFEDIVYDEYHRIIPNDAQKLYLDICTLNRLGVDVRAGLISRISGITFSDFKSAFFRPLEHIVHSRFDKYIGDYVYTARHQKVAQMVFERVLSKADERYNQISYVLGGMNIDYSSDSKAFNQLMSGRALADAFTSHELGSKLYDKAFEIAGEEPFLLQQRAIYEMMHSGGSLSAAENYLSVAVERSPSNRSIQHSWATLLRRQALETNDPLIKLKKRKEARRVVQTNIQRSNPSSYAYHIAAQLALDQMNDVLGSTASASDISVDREIVDLAKDFEEALRSGLQKFPLNEHLLALEASYRDLMRQHDRAERALQTAFDRNPRLAFIAKRLSAHYIESGKLDNALAVLKKSVRENPSSKEAHFNIARFYLQNDNFVGGNIIAEHLRRSFTKGDDNYEAQIWYGRELFLSGQDAAAKDIFSDLTRSSMPSSAKNAVIGIVESNNEKRRFLGTIKSIEESYFFITPIDFTVDIFTHRSRSTSLRDEHLKRGQKVAFFLGFNAKGPCAVDVVAQEST